MINVLNTLLFRIKKSKLLFVLLAFVVVLSAVESALYLGLLNYSGEEAEMVGQLVGGDIFSLSMSSLVRVESYAPMFTAIFVALFLGTDFSEGTIRNAVLSNKKRWQIYLAYVIVALGVGVLFVLAQAVASIVGIAATDGFADYSATEVLTGTFASVGLGILSSWVMAMGALCMLVATKKKALSLILPLASVIALSTVLEIVVLWASLQGSYIGYMEWIPFVQLMFYSPVSVDGALIGKILLINGLLAVGEGVLGNFVFAKAQLK